MRASTHVGLARRACLVLLPVPLATACSSPSEVDADLDGPLLFLVQQTRPASVMEALYEGRVEVDQQGCFRLADQADRHTVVWPFGFTLRRDNASLIVFDENDDEAVRIGDLIGLGGGEVPDLRDRGIVSSVAVAAAAERCPGRNWIVGAIQPHGGRN